MKGQSRFAGWSPGSSWWSPSRRVAAPVATAVPIADDGTRYYQEHTQQETKRLLVLRAKKVKKNRSAIKNCPPGQRRVVAARLGRCIVD